MKTLREHLIVQLKDAVHQLEHPPSDKNIDTVCLTVAETKFEYSYSALDAPSTLPDETLIPVDYDRCQAMKTTSNTFMTMGGDPVGTLVQCKDKPSFVATQNEPDPDDGRIGTMSLCDSCKSAFIKKCGEDYATLEPINHV